MAPFFQAQPTPVRRKEKRLGARPGNWPEYCLLVQRDMKPEPSQTQYPHVVIVGAGFGGLNAAKKLAGAPVKVTILDRRNFHLFQPLLYQVAAGGLAPGDIAAPVRAEFKNQPNVHVLQAEVEDFDVAARQVVLAGGERLPYDFLILATGVEYNYFGNDQWKEIAPALKTIEDALSIRRRVFEAFEEAERATDPAAREAWLTFVIAGGGPTGVEMAGTIAELAHHTLRGDFRNFDPADSKVIIIEGADRVLPPFPPKLSAWAARSLKRLGVTMLLKSLVTNVTDDHVTIKTESGEATRIPTRTVLWAAGTKANPLGRQLAAKAGAETDRIGRVVVGPDLSIPGHPELFVVGDLAHFAHQGGKPLPGVAQPAIQGGQYIARVIRARLKGNTKIAPFRYRDKGSLAVIGRNAAVADLGFMRLHGFPAWLIWAVVHIAFLIDFESRTSVMFRWTIEYLTRKRGARLITGEGCEKAPHTVK